MASVWCITMTILASIAVRGGGLGAIEGSAGFLVVGRSLSWGGGVCFGRDRFSIFTIFERRQNAPAMSILSAT
jgi:hypothetical protein